MPSKMKKKKANSKPRAEAKPRQPKPRQQDLPGMEDRKLSDVHSAALDYADARDERIAAARPEVEAKTTLLDLMKKHKLEHYKFDNVQVDITHEKENVKVKITDAAFDSESDDATPRLPKEQRDSVEAEG